MNKIIDFPEVRQSKDYTCGVSVLQALLYYYGFSYREDKLEKLVKSNEYSGTTPSNIIQFCQKIKVKTREIYNMTMDDIIYFIKNNIPIIVAMQAWGNHKNYKKIWDCGHYSVIIGINDDKLIFEDPSIIGKGYIPIDEFFERWHDIDSNGLIYDHYGLIVTNQVPVYKTWKLQKID